jgi:hypothetical protein
MQLSFLGLFFGKKVSRPADALQAGRVIALSKDLEKMGGK